MSFVSKCLEFTGCDEKDLERRIDTFRQAVRLRRGNLLEVKWLEKRTTGALRVAVVYQVPGWSASATQ